MLYKFRRFCTTPLFLLLTLLISLVGIVGGSRALLPSMIILVQVVALLLFVCDDLLPAFLPVFCIITLGATNLASLNDFVPYIPVTVTVVAGFIFHLFRYRRPLYVGQSLYGLIATSVAILLSGIATPLSSRDYTSLAAVYHVIGLSVGLILLYFLFASNRREDREYEPMRFFLWSMFFLGILCVAIIFAEFILWVRPLLEEEKTLSKYTYLYFSSFSYRNTISTLLVMCFPSAFYLAKRMKHFLGQLAFLFCGVLFVAALIFSTARTAWLCAAILLPVCLVYYIRKNSLKAGKIINLVLLLSIFFLAANAFSEVIIPVIEQRLKQGWIDPEEARVKLLLRSFEDFIAHPVFGIGISSLSNTDLYSGDGCICWYHMYFPQLWGSMGILGVAAYMYQLVIRAKLILTKPTAESTALGLIYLGLFLYSQTDVGEFTPIPFVVIALIVFVLLEDKVRRDAVNTSTKK